MSQANQSKAIDLLLGALEPQDVLEFIDFRPESMQRVGETVRCACPIHRDTSGRSLVVSLASGRFQCADPVCPGNRGGNLVELYALAAGITIENAIKALAEEFNIVLPTEGAPAQAAGGLEEGAALLAAARGITRDATARRDKLREAERRFRTVLAGDTENVAALRGMVDVTMELADYLESGKYIIRLLDLAKTDEERKELTELARTYLEQHTSDFAVRRRIAEIALAAGRREEAVQELMQLADLYEQSHQYEEALAAYRRIAEIGPDLLDTHPMVVQLLIATGRQREAVQEYVRHAQELAKRNEFRAAAESLLGVLELEPQNIPARVEAIKMYARGGPDPECAEKCLRLADELRDLGDPEKARLALVHLAGAMPRDVEVLRRLAAAQRAADRHAEARTIELRLAELTLENGNAEDAMLILEELAIESPDDVEILRRMAEVHIFEKETDAALEILDRALVIASEANDMPALLRIAERAAAIAPDDMERAIVHAEFLAAKGDLERARPIATAAAARLERESNDTLLVRAFGVLRLTDPRDARVAQRFADALERLGQPEAAEEIRLEGARLLLEARQFDRAESELRLILERFPSNTDALRLLAEVLAKSGRAAEATEVSVSLAATLRKAGSTDASRRLLESLLAHDPNNLAALAGLSDLCEELGDEDGVVKTALRMIAIYKDRRMYDDAIEQAKMALELRPNDPAAIKELVDLYDLKGDRAKMAEAMLRRVDALRRAGDRSGERDALVAILVREPRNRPALERLAFLHFELGERTEGLARLDEYTVASPVPDTVALVRELLLRNPEDTGLHLRLVSLLRKTGDRASLAAAIQQLVLVYERQDQWKDAVGLYREVLTLLPDSVMTRVSLVEALKRIGDRAGAIAELHELAKEHQAKGNDDDAMQAFDHVLRIDEFNEAAYRGQAQVLRRRGRNDLAAGRLKAYAEALRTKGQRREAVRTLRSVFEFDEANMDVRRTLVAILQEEGRAEDVERELLAMAEIQQAAGDTEGAVASIREAVSLRPGVPALRRRLVQALEASGRSNEAQAESLSLAEALFAEKKIAESRKTVEELIARNPENVRARRLRAEILVASGDEKAALEEFRAMSRQLDRIEVVGTLNREEPPTAVPLSILRENSFESFVAGPGNNFALATAKAVAKSPGTTDHNPLFLYSDVGLGKTHLLHAIANLMMDRTPGTRVNYTNAEDFTSELVDAIQNGTVNEFRNRHKGADILLLDDVQFLAGKERSQEEFFHIFNTLYQAKKQIAITSDRPPKDIAHLEKRLRSRFGAGVVVDIQPPDMETRIAILRRELRQRYADVEIVDEAILRIAERVDTNIRDLKGILNQAVLRRRVKGEEVTVAVVDDIVSRLYATK